MTLILSGLSQMKSVLEQRCDVWLQEEEEEEKGSAWVKHSKIKQCFPGRRFAFVIDPNALTLVQDHTSNVILSLSMSTLLIYKKKKTWTLLGNAAPNKAWVPNTCPVTGTYPDYCEENESSPLLHIYWSMISSLSQTKQFFLGFFCHV